MEVHDLEAECARKCQEVREGSSTDLLRIKNKLLLTKERKIATADKLLKLQIKNLRAHYDFEITDLQVQYENAVKAAKDKLIAEYTREAMKAIDAEKERKEKEERERKAKEDAELSKSSKSADGIDNVGGEEELTAAQRTTRTSGVQEFVELKGTDAGGMKVQGQHDVSKEKEKAANERKRKLDQVTTQKREFVRTIPKTAMRADFAEIIGNMEKRNREFVKTQPRNLGTNFQIVEDTFTFHMRINGRSIYTGDLVVVFSSLSRESFSGVITSIEEDEILIRCGNGTKLAFTAEQVRTGRVTVRVDDEGIAATEAIKVAAKVFREQMV